MAVEGAGADGADGVGAAAPVCQELQAAVSQLLQLQRVEVVLFRCLAQLAGLPAWRISTVCGAAFCDGVVCHSWGWRSRLRAEMLRYRPEGNLVGLTQRLYGWRTGLLPRLACLVFSTICSPGREWSALPLCLRSLGSVAVYLLVW